MIERGEFRELERKVDDTASHVIRLQEQVATMQKTLETLVSKAEFIPVKMISYGLAGTVLSSALMAVLAKVLIK